MFTGNQLGGAKDAIEQTRIGALDLIAQQYVMDPVQFGIVMLVDCALEPNTPPVGTTPFVGFAIGRTSAGQVMRTILPIYGAPTAALLAVTYVLQFSLWLPRLAGYLQ